MSFSPIFKSEVFVPIKKDNHLFEERQKNIWGDVHDRMERRRREWESEVERMRHDFFRLKPVEERRASSENLLETMELDRIFRDDVKEGKRFQVGFDVSQFSPEEISVRTQDGKIVVQAKHEETGVGKNVSREFSRTVDVPSHVDPEKLSCTLSKDGILSLEAPVSAPQYDRILKGSDPMSPPTILQAMPASLMQSAPLTSQLGLHPTQLEPQQAAEYASGALVTEDDASRKMKFVVDVGPEFTPDDISVKTIDRKLAVTARHEERSEGRTSMREFSKEFELPEDVDPNSVVASMTDDGKLILEAPLLAPNPQQPARKPHITISLR